MSSLSKSTKNVNKKTLQSYLFSCDVSKMYNMQPFFVHLQSSHFLSFFCCNDFSKNLPFSQGISLCSPTYRRWFSLNQRQFLVQSTPDTSDNVLLEFRFLLFLLILDHEFSHLFPCLILKFF